MQTEDAFDPLTGRFLAPDNNFTVVRVQRQSADRTGVASWRLQSALGHYVFERRDAFVDGIRALGRSFVMKYTRIFDF